MEIDKNTRHEIKNNQIHSMNKFDVYLNDKWLGNKKEDAQGAIDQIQDITKENMQDQFYFKLGDFDCKKIPFLIITSFIENNNSDLIGEVTANEYSEYIFS